VEKSLIPSAAIAPSMAGCLDHDLEMHQAYERVVPKLTTTEDDELEPLNLNAGVLVTRILGALPGILEHRAELEQLITFDVTQLDQLKEHTLALGHAFGLRRAAPDGIDDVPEFARRLRAMREQLQADGHTLVKRGFLDAAVLRRLRGSKAHLAVAFDVLALVEVFIEQWDAIQGRTAVTLEELDAARREANCLVAALGQRSQERPQEEANELTYRLLYSRVVRDYSEVRTALQFLRRKHGDAERIAPSPFPGCKGALGRRPSKY
jgi:hypothetical protein